MRTEFSPFSHELPKSRFSVLIILLCSVCLMLTGCGSKQKAPGTASFRPYTINGRTYYPLRSARGYVQEGRASWYGPGFHGKKTASGEIYKQYGMTAAHTVLPLHTMVRVTNLQNGRSVILRVNDRGPFIDNRVIDVSRAAALRLSMISGGTAWVRIESLEKDRDISSPEKKPASDSRAAPSEAPELQDTPSVGKQLSETTGPAAAVRTHT